MPSLRIDEKRQITQALREVDSKLYDSLNKEQRSRLASTVATLTETVVQERSSHFSGPIPPADMLKEYGSVVENGAERIFKMAENQAIHRQNLESTVIGSQNKQSERGQIFALVLAVLLIGVGAVAMWTSHDAVAGVIFGTTIVGLVAVFVVGKNQQRSDLARKDASSK